MPFAFGNVHFPFHSVPLSQYLERDRKVLCAAFVMPVIPRGISGAVGVVCDALGRFPGD